MTNSSSFCILHSSFIVSSSRDLRRRSLCGAHSRGHRAAAVDAEVNDELVRIADGCRARALDLIHHARHARWQSHVDELLLANTAEVHVFASRLDLAIQLIDHAMTTRWVAALPRQF